MHAEHEKWSNIVLTKNLKRTGQDLKLKKGGTRTKTFIWK